MALQIPESTRLKLLIGSAAAIAVLISGIAVATTWAHASRAGPEGDSAIESLPEAAIDSGTGRTICPECGVVESMRLVNKSGEGKSPRISEITIRMKDGSRHQFNASDPTMWRLGERIVLIRGSGKADD